MTKYSGGAVGQFHTSTCLFRGLKSPVKMECGDSEASRQAVWERWIRENSGLAEILTAGIHFVGCRFTGYYLLYILHICASERHVVLSNTSTCWAVQNKISVNISSFLATHQIFLSFLFRPDVDIFCPVHRILRYTHTTIKGKVHGRESISIYW